LHGHFNPKLIKKNSWIFSEFKVLFDTFSIISLVLIDLVWFNLVEIPFTSRRQTAEARQADAR